jgi:hypothetical protein
MDKLATINQPQIAFELLPAWLNYLVAAYPMAGIARMTLAVFEDQFSDVDPAVMMQAAKAHTKRSKWFPAVKELLDAVEEVELAAEERWLIPKPVWDVMQYRKAAAAWATCPECGEWTPDLNNCPFCADMAEMVATAAIDVTGREAVVTTG